MVFEEINHVWVGSELGLLKGVNISSGIFKNYGDLKCLDKSQGVTAITLMKSSDQIIIGLKDGSMKTYDIGTLQYSTPLHCGVGPVRGVVAVADGSSLTCTEDGLMKHWKDGECILEKKIGSNIQTMVGSSSHSLIAAGGEENDMKIWNIENLDKPVFAAKNVKNDFLNLRVPVWVSALEFFKGSESEIVVGTGNHNIRLYDTRVKRRPMIDVEYHEHPITSISLTKDNKTVIIGNSAGYMAEMDIRTEKIVGGFKGNAGSIRDICCHALQPYVVSCGLDRFLKVYNLTSRKLEKKIYMKSNLNCFYLTEDEIMLSEMEESRKRTKDVSDNQENEGESGNDDDEGDAVWEKMQVVKEKKKKKNEHNDDES